jgi:hypothetical protein
MKENSSGAANLLDTNVLPERLHATYGSGALSFMLFVRVKL